MDLDNDMASRIFRNVMIGFVMAATLALAADSYAADIGVQAGPITTETFAARGYAAWNAKSWLDIEAGALVVHEGAIFDITPMFHTTGQLFVGAGIGFGYNVIQNDRQSEGAIFHDVFDVGYRLTERFTIRGDVQHWSNGGHYNPAFGTHTNGGYTTITFGAIFRL